MSSTVNEVTLKLMYEDSSTRSLKFSGVDESALISVANKVKAINANVPQVMRDTFISADGAKFLWISGAKITEIEEEVIYNG